MDFSITYVIDHIRNFFLTLISKNNNNNNNNKKKTPKNFRIYMNDWKSGFYRKNVKKTFPKLDFKSSVS